MMSIGTLASKIFGSSNDRKVKNLRPRVAEINAMEPELEALSDEELRERTVQFRQQIAEGADLDSLLVPAFATVREAAKRGGRDFRSRRRSAPARTARDCIPDRPAA